LTKYLVLTSDPEQKLPILVVVNPRFPSSGYSRSLLGQVYDLDGNSLDQYQKETNLVSFVVTPPQVIPLDRIPIAEKEQFKVSWKIATEITIPEKMYCAYAYNKV